MLDPGQAAVGIAARTAGLFDGLFQQALGQSVDFQNDDALDFCGSELRERRAAQRNSSAMVRTLLLSRRHAGAERTRT